MLVSAQSQTNIHKQSTTSGAILSPKRASVTHEECAKLLEKFEELQVAFGASSTANAHLYSNQLADNAHLHRTHLAEMEKRLMAKLRPGCVRSGGASRNWDDGDGDYSVELLRCGGQFESVIFPGQVLAFVDYFAW